MKLKFIYSFLLTFLFLSVNTQNLITVPFNNGFVGDKSANGNSTKAYNSAGAAGVGLGWSNVHFDRTNEIQLAFDESIKLSDLDLHVNDQFNWQVFDSLGNIIASNASNDLSIFKFPKSGVYRMNVVHVSTPSHEKCQHSHAPSDFYIRVSPVHITFNIDQIVFSKTLNSSNLSQGLEIDIPVDVSIENGSGLSVSDQEINVLFKGVDCHVKVARIDSTLINHNGTYNLRFSAIGSTRAHSYIMIDFIHSFVKSTTYYHSTEL